MTLLYADGSVYDNGKEGQDGYAAITDSDGKLLKELNLGSVTINAAEYLGVIWALGWAHQQGISVTVKTDSQLVIGHIHKNWNCQPSLRPYRDRVISLMKETGSQVEWCSRKDNKAGFYWEAILKRKRNERRKARRKASDVHNVG